MMVWMIGLMVQIDDLETFVSVLDLGSHQIYGREAVKGGKDETVMISCAKKDRYVFNCT